MSEHARGVDLLRIPVGTLAAMHRALARQTGELEAAQILREVGLESGGAFYELLRQSVSASGTSTGSPEELDSEEFWQRVSDLLSGLGWGTLAFEQLHEGIITLSATDWAEANAAEGASGCHFTTGLLADVLRRAAGRDLAVLEVPHDGAAKGGYRVLIGGPEAIEAVYERLGNGAEYSEAVATLREF